MFPVIFYFRSSLFMTLFMIGPPRQLALAAATGGAQHGQRQDGQTSSLRRHVPVQDGQEVALQVSLYFAYSGQRILEEYQIDTRETKIICCQSENMM